MSQQNTQNFIFFSYKRRIHGRSLDRLHLNRIQYFYNIVNIPKV
ncbi:hypothetical protein QUB63_03115 [Microcoleus sp. ARI1-B5]